MAAPTATDPRQRLRSLIADAEKLTAKGTLSEEERTQVAGWLTEAHNLKATIEQGDQVRALGDWAQGSAGLLPLADGTEGAALVTSGGPAGDAFVERSEQGVRLLEQYGEGIWGDADRRRTATKEYRTGFRAYLRKGEKGLRSSELRVLQESSDTQGGFMVPADMADFIISRKPTPTRLASRVTTLQTSRDTLVVPRVNYAADDVYTTGIRVTWTGEVPASASSMRVTQPVFGQTRIPIFTAMLSIPITRDMIEDAAFPLVSFISDKFAETVDLLSDQMILNGTGQGQPSGILLNAGDATGNLGPKAIATGTAGVVGADDIVSTGYSLPEQYDENAVWVMNKTSTAAAIAQLKDQNKRYLWGSGLQDSGLAPSIRDRVLLGYPVLFSGFMPNIASGAFPVLFGDLKGYYRVQRVGFSIQVLNELYAETNQILVLGRLRFGGQTPEAFRLRAIQVA